MRNLVLVLLIALATPVSAQPMLQHGHQDGIFYAERTWVEVQPGSTFVLVGIPGDHDIYFYDEAGAIVGEANGCGDEAGQVPENAARALIAIFDNTGGVVPACVVVIETPVGSDWIYVDGL